MVIDAMNRNDFPHYGGNGMMKLIIRLETDEWVYEEHEIV